ncbi:MAG: hypothetical protein IT196_28310 [Acidimicrobiales bacterium]|nr:hypothetical protein [Acidimicrobiales bacterium]
MAASFTEAMENILGDARAAAKLLDAVTVDEIEGALRAAQEAVNVLQEVQRRTVAASLRCETWSANGFRGPDRWLARATDLRLWRARVLCHQAEAMQHLPVAQAAALAGGLHELP